MNFCHTLRGQRFHFHGLAELLAKANEVKSGDQQAGIAAVSAVERAAAKLALADVRLEQFLDTPVLPPENDDVSRLLLDHHAPGAFASIRGLTVGEFREHLLTWASTDFDWQKLAPGLLPEMAAAAAKLMSNKDLVYVARRIRNVTRCRNTLGEQGVFSVRIQPNHPADDLTGILLSTADGLALGCGDAVIGVNPATESVRTVSAILHALDRLIAGLEIPTQHCCLAHITTQMECLRAGTPIDLLFQSIAGTQAANAAFGVSLSMLTEGRQMVQEQHAQRPVTWAGSQVMYFETGQGSALSSGAHHGLDQLTLEARAYGLARTLDPFLVNSVVGFIGPEYLYDERQIVRAGLEDHFMGKLLGLPMGCDVCYTNHAQADQNSVDNLAMLLAAAGCNFIMGVPGTDDVMLNYQSTSYHDAAMLRQMLHLRPAPEFLAWLEDRGLFVRGALPAVPAPARLQLLDEARRLGSQ